MQLMAPNCIYGIKCRMIDV